MIQGTCAVNDCNEPITALDCCDKHYRRLQRHGLVSRCAIVNNDIARFWSKVAEGDVPANAPSLGPCWLWQAGCYERGYGHFSYNIGPKQRKHVQAHRWSYEYMIADIPEPLELDHLCRVHGCVNPYHLDPVPHIVNARRGVGGENMRSKTHCPLNHEYTVVNTYINRRGSRTCRKCQKLAQIEYQKRRNNGWRVSQ